MTPAQAAQNGYHQRKAAKLYAEKRRAKAEKEAQEGKAATRKEVEPTDVINITVDAKGVMIDNAKGSSQATPGMGARKNSRSRMTRSTSKSRNSFRRVEDKENVTYDSSSFRTPEKKIEAYFSRKRSTDISRCTKDSLTENSGSWDGSMPKRQGSRSFIESRAGARNLGDTEKQVGAQTSTVPRSNTETSVSERLRLLRAATSSEPDNATGGAEKQAANEKQQQHMTNTTGDDGSIEKSETQVESSESSTIADVQESTARDSVLSTTGKTAPLGCRVLGHAGLGSSASPNGVDRASQTEKSGTCSAGHAQKALGNGKWCDDCAGLGLHIAALLSELDKRRSTSESSSEASSSSSGSKKGWKSMVTQTMLGDSKSKSSSEKARLQQEIEVLRATVDFLYKKVELMEVGVPKIPSQV